MSEMLVIVQIRNRNGCSGGRGGSIIATCIYGLFLCRLARRCLMSAFFFAEPEP